MLSWSSSLGIKVVIRVQFIWLRTRTGVFSVSLVYYTLCSNFEVYIHYTQTYFEIILLKVLDTKGVQGGVLIPFYRKCVRPPVSLSVCSEVVEALSNLSPLMESFWKRIFIYVPPHKYQYEYPGTVYSSDMLFSVFTTVTDLCKPIGNETKVAELGLF